MENWKKLDGFYGLYEISDHGRIRNTKRGKIMKQNLNRNGQYQINLSENGFRSNFMVHKLVAETFLDNPENYNNVLYKDGDKTNIHVSNLEWSDANINKMKKTRKKTLKLDETGSILGEYESINEAARQNMASPTNISLAIRKKRLAYGYYWCVEGDDLSDYTFFKPEENAINTEELLFRLKISIHTLHNLRKQGLPKIETNSSAVKFSYNEVLKWIGDQNGIGESLVGKKLIDINELSDKLNLSKRILQQYRGKGMPAIFIYKSVMRFVLEDVEAWLLENRKNYDISVMLRNKNVKSKKITTKDLMVILDVSRATIHRYKKRGMPKVVVNQTNVYYNLRDVLDWIKDKNRLKGKESI